jgi:hypothetical protein
VIGAVAAAALTQSVAIRGEKPVAVVNSDMRFVGQEFPDQLLDIRHINIPK